MSILRRITGVQPPTLDNFVKKYYISILKLDY